MSTNPYPRAPQIRPQLLKVPEVAEILGVKPRTIYEMVAKGTHTVSQTARVKHLAF